MREINSLGSVQSFRYQSYKISPDKKLQNLTVKEELSDWLEKQVSSKIFK